MANLRSLLISLFLALAAFSLASHFIADGACWSIEVSVLSQCDAAKLGNSSGASQLAANPLHTGVFTPAVFSIATPFVLCLALVGVSFNRLSRSISPPVQPPKSNSIV